MLGITTCKPSNITRYQANCLNQTSELLNGSSRVVHFRAHRVAIVEDSRPGTNLGYKVEKCHAEVS